MGDLASMLCTFIYAISIQATQHARRCGLSHHPMATDLLVAPLSKLRWDLQVRADHEGDCTRNGSQWTSQVRGGVALRIAPGACIARLRVHLPQSIV
jgi:hypothetical protein